MGDVGAQDRRDLRLAQGIDHERAGAARAVIDQRQNLHLLNPRRIGMRGGRPGVGIAADEGLIRRNVAAVTAERGQLARTHGLADAMREKPRGLVGGLKGAVQLVGGDTLLAGAHQEDRLQPLRHRQLRLLEDRAHADGELLTALAAVLQAEANPLLRVRLDGVDAVAAAAVRADRTLRPQDAFNEGEGGGFIVEVAAFAKCIIAPGGYE